MKPEFTAEQVGKMVNDIVEPKAQAAFLAKRVQLGLAHQFRPALELMCRLRKKCAACRGVVRGP